MNLKTIYCKAIPYFLSIRQPLPYFLAMERGLWREQATADHSQNPSMRHWLCVMVGALCLGTGLHLLCCREGPSHYWDEPCGPCRQKLGAGLLVVLASLGLLLTRKAHPKLSAVLRLRKKEVWHSWLWAMDEYFTVENVYGREGLYSFQVSPHNFDFKHLVLLIVPSVIIRILLSPAKNPKPPLKFLWFSVLL